jgi:hypothetical protein
MAFQLSERSKELEEKCLGRLRKELLNESLDYLELFLRTIENFPAKR